MSDEALEALVMVRDIKHQLVHLERWLEEILRSRPPEIPTHAVQLPPDVIERADRGAE